MPSLTYLCLGGPLHGRWMGFPPLRRGPDGWYVLEPGNDGVWRFVHHVEVDDAPQA